MEVEETHLFRVTRDADFEIEEDEAADLLEAIEAELRRRRFGEAVRLEVERTMPPATRRTLLTGIGLSDESCYEVSGMLDLTALWTLHGLPRPDLKDPRVDGGGPAAARPRRGRRARGRLRGDPRRRHPRPPPVRELHGDGRAVRRAGGGRSRRPRDQADALPDERRLPHRPRPHPRRRGREAGRRHGRDQGPLRRGEQHHLGPPPGAGRRPRRVRDRGPQDAQQDAPGRAPRGRDAPAVRPHRDGQLQLRRRPASTWTSASSRSGRRSPRT